MAKVTLKQIAERAGVSINTVSLALRDKPNVNPDTRARICGIAAELGERSAADLAAFVMKRCAAAGCTISAPIAKAKEMVLAEVEKML